MSDGDRQRRGDGAGRERDHAVERRALELTATGLAWLAAIAQAHDELAAEDDDPVHDLGARRLDHPRRAPGRGSSTSAIGRSARARHPTSAGKHALTSRLGGPPVRRSAEPAAQPAAMPDVTGLTGGSPLPSPLLAQLEAALGFDLGAVRVHTDAAADRAARALGARAFAVGHDIGFRAGAYDPSSAAGVHLIAHEVAHTTQPSATTDRPVSQPDDPAERAADAFADSFTARPAAAAEPVAATRSRSVAVPPTTVRLAPDPAATKAPPVPPPAIIKQVVDRIVGRLKGYTTAWDSAAVVAEFAAFKDKPRVLQAILDELKQRAAQHEETPEGMVRWLLGDLTAEGRRDLIAILSKAGATTDISQHVAAEIHDELSGWTSASDSKEIARKLQALSGPSLDGVLVKLQAQTKQSELALVAWLFGDLARTDAERLRVHFFAAGGPLAQRFAALHTAEKLESLIAGYTSHADSSSIVWYLEGTPAAQRPSVREVLAARVQSRWHQTLEDVLQQDMDRADYDRVGPLLQLGPFDQRNQKGIAGRVLSAAEWLGVAAEVVAGAAVGVVTGLISFLWDFAAIAIDVVVAAKHLIMSAFYCASLGAVGSADWLATKEFFAGLGTLVTDPGAVLAAAWEETKLGSSTISGPLEHGRRAEYWARKTINFVLNVVTIVKGAAKGAKALGKGVKNVVKAGPKLDALAHLGEPLLSTLAKEGLTAEEVAALSRVDHTVAKQLLQKMTGKDLAALESKIGSEGLAKLARENELSKGGEQAAGHADGTGPKKESVDPAEPKKERVDPAEPADGSIDDSITSQLRALTGRAKRAEWVSKPQGTEGPGVRDHFGKHGSQVNASSARAYDLSARRTIQNGRRFRYRDRTTNDPRVGYWDSATGFFTATSETRGAPAIMTHYPETWSNLKKLPGFTAE